MTEFKLTDLIKPTSLQKIQDAFSQFTGMASITTDANGEPVTEGSGFTSFCMDFTRKSAEGLKRCKNCDKMGAIRTLKSGRPVVYYCHAGLIDYAAPIMVEGELIGSFIGGQVRPADLNEEKLIKTANELRIDPQKYLELAKDTKIKTVDEVKKAAGFLYQLASFLSNMAYENYCELKFSRKNERNSRTQTVYLTDVAKNMQSHMHEWTAILTHALETDDLQKIHNSLYKIMDQGREMYSKIDGVIDFIQLSNGKAELAESEYDLRQVAKSIIDRKISQITNNVKVEYSIDDSVPDLMLGDSGRIFQVVTTLLQGSLFHVADDGKISIKFYCTNESYAKMLNVEVIDNGEGMTEDELSDVRFYFTTNSSSIYINEEMARLGFPLINMIVKALFGIIKVDSKENEGTKMHIIIPQLEVKR